MNEAGSPLQRWPPYPPRPHPPLRRYGQRLVDAAAEVGYPLCMSYVTIGADGKLTAPVQDLRPATALAVNTSLAGDDSGSSSRDAGSDIDGPTAGDDDSPAKIYYVLNCKMGLPRSFLPRYVRCCPAPA